MPRLRLLSIPISHYCEKARWALDRLGLEYIEERHLQVFHYLRSYQLSRGANVPVLIDGNTTVTDSTLIMQYLDRYATAETCLYPESQRQAIAELEDLFDETLGIESRRWVYYHALKTPTMALRTSAQGVPGWQASIAPFFYPLLKSYINFKLDISTATINAGLARARAVIDTVDNLLRDGRPFLVGDRFSAADLTLAAMMAPFVMPREYGVRLPQLDEISDAMRETVNAMRATRAGQHALHLYHSQRTLNTRHATIAPATTRSDKAAEADLFTH